MRGVGKDYSMEDENVTPKKANLLAIELSNFPNIRIHYNIPVRNHSTTVFLNYNVYTDEAVLSVKLLGDDRRGDLYASCLNALFESIYYGINYEALPTTVKEREAQIIWKWTSADEGKEFHLHGIIKRT